MDTAPVSDYELEAGSDLPRMQCDGWMTCELTLFYGYMHPSNGSSVGRQVRALGPGKEE